MKKTKRLRKVPAIRGVRDAINTYRNNEEYVFAVDIKEFTVKACSMSDIVHSETLLYIDYDAYKEHLTKPNMVTLKSACKYFLIDTGIWFDRCGILYYNP